MHTLEKSLQARYQLDQKFASANSAMPLVGRLDRPVKGWIRAVRDALGMTSRQLAARMGIAETSVPSLEKSEMQDTIQLDTLRRAAHALNCELVYAIVPRTSLEDVVQQRALALAQHDIAGIDQTMRLENQALKSTDVEERVHAYAQQLIQDGKIWQIK